MQFSVMQDSPIFSRSYSSAEDSMSCRRGKEKEQTCYDPEA